MLLAPDHIRSDNGPEFTVSLVRDWLHELNVRPLFIEPGSPWENGTAEPWVGACRQELLDHVIVLGEAHLRRVLREDVAYHHEDRTHCGLGKQTPMHRTVQAARRADD